MKQKINSEIIATGSEIMLGRMVDTNSSWLSDTLGAAGVNIVRHTAVGDDKARIIAAFQKAWQDNTLTVVTGGLGPTEDDLTRIAASEAFSRRLIFHQELADELKAHFTSRGYLFTENNLRQAWLPENSLLVPNPLGTAPGFALEEKDRLMIFLPGVPQEMKRMIIDWALPRIKNLYPASGCRKTVVLKTSGLGESAVDDRIGDLMREGRNPVVGLLAAPDMVRVIVTAEGESDGEAECLLEPLVGELEKRLAGHIFAHGDETVPQTVAALLKKSGLRLTILDAATQGRLTGLLGPALLPENWGGARDLPCRTDISGVREILHLYAPGSASLCDCQGSGLALHKNGEIRLAVTARPEPGTSKPDDLKMLIECGIHSALLNDGQPLMQQFQVGGPAGRALARAASLAAFHLWRVLSQSQPKAD